MIIALILAIIGLCCIIIGSWSVLYLSRFAKSERASLKWKKLRAAVLLVGMVIGVLSWPGTFFMGYPISSDEETLRVVGIPFFVAYFDSKGHDYVGPLTALSILCNGIFWFLLPHILFVIYTKNDKRHINPVQNGNKN